MMDSDFSMQEQALIEQAQANKEAAEKDLRESSLEAAYCKYRSSAYTMLEVFKTCPKKVKNNVKDSVQYATKRMIEIRKSLTPSEKRVNTLSDIKGNDAIRDEVREILDRCKVARSARQSYSDPSFLLYGASGIGKTHMAEMIAKEYGSSCTVVRCTEIRDKYIGESEKKMKAIFEEAAKNKSALFFDEMHALLGSNKKGESEVSENIISEFLQEMNARSRGILVIGASNRPRELNSAVVRRFGSKLHMPLPDEAARCALIKELIANTGMLTILREKDIERYSQAMSGYTPDDIRRVIEEAQGCGLKRLKSAQYFTIVKAGGKPFYIPCKQDNMGSRKMTTKSCPGHFTTVMCNPYMSAAMKKVKKTYISEEDLTKLASFGKSK